MKALLLAAGYGTRLRPLTESVPKCLVPIRGRPLLEYWLELLVAAGVGPILINTHYLAEVVAKFVATSRWREWITLVHEEKLLGTGGTVLHNRAFLEDGPFLVAHADNLVRFDMRAFAARHAGRPAGVDITMMTFTTDAPQTCGIVVEDAAGIVREFHEKVADPPGCHANGAVYIFEPGICAFLQSLSRESIDLSTEVIPRYLGRICTFHNSGYHRDIGSLDSLHNAELEYPG